MSELEVILQLAAVRLFSLMNVVNIFLWAAVQLNFWLEMRVRVA